MPFDPLRLIDSWNVLLLCHKAGTFPWINWLDVDYTEAVEGLVFASGQPHCQSTNLAPNFQCKAHPQELVILLRNMTWRDLTVKIRVHALGQNGSLKVFHRNIDVTDRRIADRLEAGHPDFGRDAWQDVRAYKSFSFRMEEEITVGFVATVNVSVTHWEESDDPEAVWEHTRSIEVKL